jgi:hypothetical protein
MAHQLQRPCLATLCPAVGLCFIVTCILAIDGRASERAFPNAERAQPSPDPVRVGYQFLHAGDKEAARRHFDGLLKQHPDDLALRLGSLIARRGQLDNDESLIPAYERDLNELLRMAEARYDRSERDSDALRYLASGHMLRAAYRFEHDKGMWGAARDAAKAKNYSDSYVQRHPDHGDAYLTLGLYNYFVDIAPAFVKVLRILLFLPAGNRVEGLKQIERAAAEGDLVAPLAQQNLLPIYSLFEGRAEQAVALAERLQQRFPANDDFAMTIADVYAGPALEDHDRAANVYAAIAKRRANDSTLDGSGARYRAILGLAIERFEQWRTQEAIDILTPVIDQQVTKPEWVAPMFLLRRGNLRALLNDPDAASDLKRVQSEFKGKDWRKNAVELERWTHDRRASGEAADFAALIPANRLAAERMWTEARKAYEAVLVRQPASPWAQYRLAYTIFMTESPDRSLARFSNLAANRRAWPSVRGMALLHVARIQDLAGRRDEALKTYRTVANDFDEERAGRLAQVGLVTPYKRPRH